MDDISERDQQAMRNFYDEGISLETLVEHFHCDPGTILEIVLTRPWLRSRRKATDLGQPGTRWWESDHSDALELAKLYYPEQLQVLYPTVSLEIQAQEKPPDAALDAEAWLVAHFGEQYVTSNNIALIQRGFEEVVEFVGKIEPEKLQDHQYLLTMLDKMFQVNK